ncbi:hypothetical protein LUZ63_002211 [Rhynchospora breviuscula]|uniref:Elongator complex protein 2 n=1 Tax=Rhynchospora breviuscula TaxID=2022672 RepID=A0A9Q0HXS6_9POAL|nr:hypothetical protein LUZ63_002211 [Rhynchospora breviuscula]
MAPANGGGDLAVEQVFVGAGCNRIVNNVSWGPSGLVAFGAQNAVAIFCPQSAQILTTLPGHKAVVNCTQWVLTNKDIHKVGQKELHYLLSGSADGVIMAWEICPSQRIWRPALQFPGMHKKGVTCLTSVMISATVAICASTSSDGIVHIWKITFPSMDNGNCQISCLDSLSVGSKPMVALSLTMVPGENCGLLLAMGGLDQKIHVYYGDLIGKFSRVCELKDHSDWIRSLDFSQPVMLGEGKHNLFLVSSSQDKTIRIWKLASSPASELKKDDIGLTAYIEGPVFVVGSTRYQVSLESLLIGHEDWVYSVEWQPPILNGSNLNQPMSILSASMDKTMMIWRPERNTGIWMNIVTVGELSHSALGFYGGHWAPDGKSILAHGYGGSFHLWRDVGFGSENWQPQRVPLGHFASVFDLAWCQFADYLLTVSHDQTTRIFAPWKNVKASDNRAMWHEIARPQVHGHDINCVCIIQGSGNHRFVSGADEKVARVFEAPLSFLKTLNYAWAREQGNFDTFDKEVQILGANMSALGLSQKPVYLNSARESPTGTTNDAMDSLETIPDAVPTVFTEPPVEEQLAWHTLWPESHKLYGHGNELFSLCCNHAGTLVASSCKAQSANVAEIWLWEVVSWKAVGRLQSHTLTVTQIEFSHDDALLLTVSRDRQLSVFSLTKTSDGVDHKLIAKHEAHKRIIWACSWNPVKHEFATGSRDKTVKIWSVNKDSSSVNLLSTLPQFRDSVTALAWCACNQFRNTGLLAVGMDNGFIEIWDVTSGSLEAPAFSATCAIRLDPFLCHVSTVYRLRWKEVNDSESGILKLASCGADHSVRLFDVHVK